MNIPLMKVFMPPKEILLPEIEKILYSGMITEGEKVKEFEEEFQKKFNIKKRPLSVNSGTSALQLAYRLTNKDENKKIVITSPMTCFANVCAIINEGLSIVWCDINYQTGNIDIEDVERKVKKYGRKNIAAISFVDLGGMPNDIDRLSDIAKPDIALIQDAAQSLGSKWNNTFAGADERVDFVCFSFQAVKHLTTIDGGMLVVNSEDPETYKRAKKLKWFGIDRESAKEATRWHYDIEEPGYKFHMNNVNATIGLCQLKYIEDLINKHKENGKIYKQTLEENIKTKEDPLAESSYWIYLLKIQDRKRFAKKMQEKGIATNIAHIRNDHYTCVKKNFALNPLEKLNNLEKFEKEYIFIPSGWWVSSNDINRIVNAINEGW